MHPLNYLESNKMRNKIIVDWKGNTDYLVIFTPEEIGLANRLNGRRIKEYWFSKYQNTIINGMPYSGIHQRPAVNLDKSSARRYCMLKGDGWHLTTNEEWDAIVKVSKSPGGNTAYGRNSNNRDEQGMLYAGGFGKTLTGSGPVNWNHNKCRDGISDMCGNVYEFVDGTIVRCNKVLNLGLADVLSGRYGSEHSVVRGGNFESGKAGDISNIDILHADDKGESYGFRAARIVFE